MPKLDTTDRRVQIILRALRDHPDYSNGELWELVLYKHFEGYGGKGKFNFGYVERIMPRLRKAGLIERGERYRMRLTPTGQQAIIPLGSSEARSG